MTPAQAEVGTLVTVDPLREKLRVEGGWLYTLYVQTPTGLWPATTTFVPDPPQQAVH